MRIPKKLAGRVVLLLGEHYQHIDELKAVVRAEGGVVATKLDKRVHLIVDLPKKTKARTQAMNQAKALIKAGAAIEILGYQAFHDRIQPTPGEAVQLLRAGGAGHKRLQRFLACRPYDMDLCFKGESFAGFKWPSGVGQNINFEDCDLSRADLRRGSFDSFTGCKLDGANLDGNDRGGFFTSCSLRGVRARDAHLGARESDLTGANLEGSNVSTLDRCVAKKARFAGGGLTYARFAGTDFQGASFQRAVLDGGDLSNTKLGGASFADANLERVSLQGADLTGADLRGARLGKAKLGKAIVVRADFTGAVTTGADLTGVNLASAIGLGPAKKVSGGPHLGALLAAVKGAREVSIKLDIRFQRGPNIEVDLRVAGPYSSWLQIDRIRRDGMREGTMEHPPNLKAGMLEVANRFGDGKPNTDRIDVRSKKSKVSGKPLTALVVAAWCELFGLPVPAPSPAVAAALLRPPRPKKTPAPAAAMLAPVPKKKAPPPPVRKVRPGAPIDVATFMKRIARDTDPDRLAKAVKMLKADRFRLFSDVSDSKVVGVVKSQTDAELVYACALDDAGAFSCCTQNLNVCGGLRGSLCKHLLVLVVGLTQAGALDPTRVDAWVKTSARAKPVLDRDAMSEIFLKYKGAETGQLDWRPVETIPEDYYAL